MREARDDVKSNELQASKLQHRLLYPRSMQHNDSNNTPKFNSAHLKRCVSDVFHVSQDFLKHDAFCPDCIPENSSALKAKSHFLQ